MSRDGLGLAIFGTVRELPLIESTGKQAIFDFFGLIEGQPALFASGMEYEERRWLVNGWRWSSGFRGFLNE